MVIRSVGHNRDTRTSKSGVSTLYEVLDAVLVRAPLLPVEAYLSLGGSAKVGEGDAGQGPQTLESDTLLRRDPRIRSALAVGSRDLFDAMERAEANEGEFAALHGKLLRYMIRMSTRPTPYGMFAGVALARWGSRTNIALASHAPQTQTRPDMEWLLQLVFALEAQPEIRKDLHFFANSNAFIHAGRVFLTEPAPGGRATTPEDSVSFRATEAVRRTLTIARSPVPYHRLVADLLSVPGATSDKVERMITSLWEQTILLTDLRPPLTVACPARYVAQRLDGIPAAVEARALLERVLSAMAIWDALPVEQQPTKFRDLVTLARSATTVQAESTAQVDMAFTLDGCCIGDTVAQEAVAAAELLLRLTPWPRGPAHIDAYRQAFEHRYGPGCEVGLLEVLNPDFGLGPPSVWGQGGLPAGMDPSRYATRQLTLRDLALDALRERRLVVQLDDDTLARLDNRSPGTATLPPSLDISLFVVADSAAAIDAGEFSIVLGPNVGAQAAGRNLGRFAGLLGPDAEAVLRHSARAEQAHAPNALWAEVSYLPHRFRSANVTIRPLARDHEITVGTTGDDSSRNVIPLNELAVGVRDGRFYVRWPARNTDVIPCAGHMLNTSQAPAACRFLEDLRQDGVTHLSDFDWGPAADFPFLPRMERGRLVLSLARWRLGDHLPSESPDDFEPALQKWRVAWQVPRYVYLTVGDNRLLLDLENAAQIEELRVEIRRLPPGSYLLLQEALPAPHQAWTEGPGGRYVLELMVPLSLRRTTTGNVTAVTPPTPRPLAAVTSRLRPPGSEWLFTKLYCPRAFEKDLIAGPMPDFCQWVRSNGSAQDWFFVRYSDPDFHVRLRFRGNPDRLVGELFPQLCSWAQELIRAGLCSRFCFDTYEREVSRYGGPGGTAAAETLFAADSRAAVELLRLSQEAGSEVDRTTLAVLSIDDLLTGLGLSEAEVSIQKVGCASVS
ncbi:lantibiotic dehydratase [Streptomyces sp. NBC_01320]|uniref:lantibiotic dehydratase n=1 Tax=Streptomyces sp. NBC_01320 TaxID=2903824 RepID=UPI002E11C8D7|nr:lantibiotic dehydratase [Streptomyces sp. NBC_01320]